MTTKTREEAIEEVKRQVEIQQKNNGLCGQLEYTNRSVFARCFKGGEFFNVVEEFTPPKPEFEKGTIGLDQDSGVCFYKELNSISDYVVCSCRTSLNETGGYTTSTFTPIYQTDPIEKLAFELACEVIIEKGYEEGTLDGLLNSFLSLAREELSK